MAYETIAFYYAYKIDFTLNRADRTLGKLCGKGGDTSMLGNFNDFASCFQDKRGSKSPQEYQRDPRGETTIPVFEDIIPNLVSWGFVKGNPGSLVTAWGAPNQNDDVKHGEVMIRTMTVISEAQKTNPKKIDADDLTKIKSALAKAVEVRWKENRQAMLKRINNQLIAQWTKRYELPTGSIKANTKLDTGGFDILNTDDPLSFTDDVPVDKQGNIRASLTSTIKTVGVKNEQTHTALLDKIAVARLLVEGEACP